jgi:HD-GYP domain-containing protein (c-di-GMP phosphodiesterase class II)
MDGSGYPEKLKGEAIHPYARIVAIADAFDALTAGRPGIEKITPQEALSKPRTA